MYFRLLFTALAGLQLLHFCILQGAAELFQSTAYRLLLYSVAPAFYLSSRGVLFPDTRPGRPDRTHLIPLVPAIFAPFGVAFPLAFAIGATYLLVVLRRLYGLREQRKRFHLEAAALILLTVLAGLVLLLVSVSPLISTPAFVALYSIAIGTGFVVLQWLMVVSPAFTEELGEAVRIRYADSTLGGIDTDKAMSALAKLMDTEKIYTDERLTLTSVAARLELTPHQLSELINTRTGTGFSQYIRAFRIDEARRQLIEQPKASVLSIGLAVGFTSQSNFYAAFREVVGLAPGEFRKRHLHPPGNTSS